MLNIYLKVVGTRRVPSTSSKRRNELRDYKRHFYKSSGTWRLSQSVLMRQIIMHTPQLYEMLGIMCWAFFIFYLRCGRY